MPNELHSGNAKLGYSFAFDQYYVQYEGRSQRFYEFTVNSRCRATKIAAMIPDQLSDD